MLAVLRAAAAGEYSHAPFTGAWQSRSDDGVAVTADGTKVIDLVCAWSGREVPH